MEKAVLLRAADADTPLELNDVAKITNAIVLFLAFDCA
jgi:hypothetical protein